VASVDPSRLLKILPTELVTVMGGGLGVWKAKVIRIGHMGLGATGDAVHEALQAIQDRLAWIAQSERRE